MNEKPTRKIRLAPADAIPREIDVDGYVDARGIQYFGKATRQEDGTFRCIAALSPSGPLCIVEVTITSLEKAS